MQSPAIQVAVNNLIEAVRTSLMAEFLELLRQGKPARPKWAGAKRKGAAAGKRSAGGRLDAREVELAGKKILAYVKANPDQRLEQIAKGLNTDTKSLKLPMLKLLARPAKVVRKGVRRGTTYRVR
jgi:hypothetical protein